MGNRIARLLCALAAFTLAAFATTAEPEWPRAERGDGYRGLWFTLGQRSEYGDKYSGAVATFAAQHTPVAVYAPAVDRTYFVYGGSPDGSRRLQCMIGSYDHRTRRVSRPVVVHDKSPVDDPHDNASLCIDAQGYLWVFVSGRSNIRPGFVYRSGRPHDLSQFECVVEKPMAYPQPWLVRGRGMLNFFSRYAEGRELYWETSADGRAWSPAHKLAGFGGHYQISGAHGTTLASCFNVHPSGKPDMRTNLYYVKTTDFGATWTTAAGEPLSLPLTQTINPALVIDYAAEGRLVYPCDLNFDSDGDPVVLYIVARGSKPGPAMGGRVWTLAHWKKGKWRFSTVATSDHNYDMGSLYVLPDEWRVMAPTSPGSRPWTAGGELVLWISHDEGRTWERRRDITTNSELNHNYARRPRDARDPFFAFWADGHPDHESASRLYFCDSTGAQVWRLPYTFPSGMEWMAPESVDAETLHK